MIPYGRQHVSQADIDAVIETLKSNFLTQGSMGPRFESSVASYCGANHAVAVSNGTAALHIACMALDVGPGDCVWTSPISFVASANCALYCGATIDFVDINPNTYNMDIDCLKNKLIDAKRQSKLPKVVIPVHMCGQSCDMIAIHELAEEFKFKIVEDASHAIGGKYKVLPENIAIRDSEAPAQNKPIGSCHYSDITVFSFHPVKIVTAGEGGMALTNDPALANRLQRARNHGLTSMPAEMEERPGGEIWNYQQSSLGYNYRLTDIQAALGTSQLERIDEFVDSRHRIARRYDEELAGLPITVPWEHPDSYSANHLYIVRLQLDKTSRNQQQIYEFLREQGIGVNLHYIPIYLQPYYERIGFERGYCPEAEKYYSEALTIPLYPTMTEQQQGKVISALAAATI